MGNGNSSSYTGARYLIGRGTASTDNDARDRARADLAKQFEVAIEEQSHQSQRFEQTTKGTSTTQTLEQQVSRSLQTLATRTLLGAEIAHAWHDPVRKQHHALAILERTKARQQFEQEITALDQLTEQRLKQADTEAQPLVKAARVQQAINALGSVDI